MSTKNSFELSNPQKRIWLTETLYNHVDMSNIGYLIELKGKYNLELLAQAVKLVVKANKGLQLTFHPSGNDKTQLLQSLPDFHEPSIITIQSPNENDLLEQIQKLHGQRFTVPGPDYLCSFAVFSINNERFGLFEKAHHLVADGISATIVAREIIETYDKLENNQDPNYSKNLSYLDFLTDEQEYCQGEKYANDKNFWVQHFQDFQTNDLSFDLFQDKKNSLKVNRLTLNLPTHLINPMNHYISQNRLSMFSLFLTALSIYFYRFMNLSDFVMGMPVHNRSKKIFRDMAGMFVSTIPLRIRFQEDWNFDLLAAYIKNELWETLKHQSYPYNHLVKDLKDQGIDTSNFLNVQLIELPGANHDKIAHRAFYSTAYNISQLSIYLNQQNSKNLDELQFAIDYHTDIFQERDIAFLFKRLFIILEQTLNQPSILLPDLPLLDETELNQLLHQLNQTSFPFPKDKTLHQLFEDQVIKTANATALECENESISYQELNNLSNHLANQLFLSGATHHSIIGILCERSIEAIIAIFAILKAGAAYVPIDPAYPTERKHYIIENSDLKILILEKSRFSSEQNLLDSLPMITAMPIDYKNLPQTAIPLQDTPPYSSEDIAYVIYTSGTTGNPKGTLLRHRNVINYISWGTKVYLKKPTTTFPLFTSLSFDLTVTSIFIPLLSGNKIIIYRDTADGLLIERVVKENQVDIIKCTPSHLKVINQAKFTSSRVSTFILGGEELRTDTAAETLNRFGLHTNIYNEYGPTETAVGCMIHRYDKEHDTGMAVPIGKPSDNVRIYILDKNKKPLPLGFVGEIYISGEGVALGYLKNPQLTNEKFLDDPFSPGKKMYKSGDLGRWNLDHILEFFGRCDEQVKIRGFRIEPGEIEKQLLKIPGIHAAAVLLHKTPVPGLCAYIVSDENKPADVALLRQQLSHDLPDYMIPAGFVQVDLIPLTRNGKVDARKLLTMGKKLESSQEYVAPRSEIETLLVDTWSSVLNCDKIGITHNFFELGGDSIKAVQVAARLNDAGKTINVKDILSHQTIANICAHVDFDSHIRKYEQGIISGEKELTPIESWFFSRPFDNPDYYHQSVFLEFKFPIQVNILQHTCEKLIEHYDGLRLNYSPETRRLFFNNQLLHVPFLVQKIELFTSSPQSLAQEIQRYAHDIRDSFDITHGFMLRVVLFRVPGDPDRLLIILHHLVTDGLTWRILLPELSRIYSALEEGKEVQMPQKTASLHDWADALVMYRDSGKLEKEKSYWLETENISFQLPYDYLSQNIDWNYKNRETIQVQLNEKETGFLLKEAHEAYKTDVLVLVTTALVRSLRQWTGRHDIVMEMENHGRHIQDIDTSKTVGWFTAIYPLLVNRRDQSIGDEIKTVKEAIRRVPGQGLGYGIMKFMTPAGKTMKNERAEVRFNYLGQFDREVDNPLFSLSSLPTGPDVSPVNQMTAALEIDAMVLHDRFTAAVHYNKEVFKPATMVSFSERYIKNLKEILDHIKNEDDVHFTSSDFDTVDLSEDDLANLFG